MGACEMLFAPRAIAAKKFRFRVWALALARLLCAGAGPVRRWRGAGLGGQAFGATRPVLPALGLTFFSTVGGTPIALAGSSSPPALGCSAAFGTTVSSLGRSGTKGFLAALEQTEPLPGPTCPLTGSWLAASLMWAQGSCELPTAKPRTRRLSLRSEAPCLSTFTPHPSYDDWAWIPSHVARYRSTANHR